MDQMQLGLPGLPETFTCARCQRELPVQQARERSSARIRMGRGVLCEECHLYCEARSAVVQPPVRPPMIAKRFIARSAGQSAVESDMRKMLQRDDDGIPPW